MAQSPLLGTTSADQQADGSDVRALGPSDSSDSGSDVAGTTEDGAGDPAQPIDKALRDDAAHPVPPAAGGASSSDAAGTGERRSADAAAGTPAADISPDHTFGPGGDAADDDIDARDRLRRIAQDDAGDEREDESS